MLIAAFVATLITFTVTKLAILCGAKHGYPSLWRIAIIKNLQEEIESQRSSTRYDEQKAKQIACCYRELLTKEYYKKYKKELNTNLISISNYFRMTTLFLSTVGLPSGILMSFLSYDLHPLSCIFGPSEDYISYNVTTEAVYMNFSESILTYQRVTAGIIVVLGVCYIINASCFYCFNMCIIYIFKKQVNSRISESYKQKQVWRNHCLIPSLSLTLFDYNYLESLSM